MKNLSNVYIYSGLAIALSIVGYYAINYKKPNTKENKSTSNDTTSADVIEYQQEQIPITLADIFVKKANAATILLKNKSIYTKVNNVNARKTYAINDGFINNKIGVIASKNTLIGNIVNVFEDDLGAQNNSNRIYKWVQVKLSADAINEINKSDTSFFSIKLNPKSTYYAYFREDTISLTNKN